MGTKEEVKIINTYTWEELSYNSTYRILKMGKCSPSATDICNRVQ